MSRTKQRSKPSLYTTRTSLFHKALTRDTKPAWGNRIFKDFYDLDYQVKSDIFHINHQFKNNNKQKKNKIRQNIKSSIQKTFDGQIEKRKEGGRVKKIEQKRRRINIQVNRRINPQTIEIGALLGSQSQTLGLCPFQYKNTIQGRIKQKLAFHLSFDKNKVNRSVNLNPIFYDRHHDIDYNYSRLMHERKIMKQYHPFNSYTPRRVFQPRPQLDKIYDIENARKFASPQKEPEAVRKFELVVQRKEERKKQSSLLAYETVDCIDLTKEKQYTLPMNKEQRQIIFYPQVISPSRGCYR